MIRRRLRLSPGAVAMGVAGLVTVGVLLVTAASHTVAVRRFTLGVPDSSVVRTVQQSRRVCEGPITVRGPVRIVGVFGRPVPADAAIRADVRVTASKRIIASGLVPVTAQGGMYVPLDHVVDDDRPLDVCITTTRNAVSLFGNLATPPVHIDGGRTLAFSLVLVDPGQTLLSALPVAFAHASLFKLSWFGAWTFWAVLGLLVASIAVAVFGVAAAEQDDAAE